MKIFNEFNEFGPPCPVCKTYDNKQTVLIPIYGTEEGNKCKAKQIHLECIDLLYYENTEHPCAMIQVVRNDDNNTVVQNES